MHLRGDHADQLIEALSLSGMPFLILSGSDQSAFRAAHPHITVLAKLFDKAELEQCVRHLLPG